MAINEYSESIEREVGIKPREVSGATCTTFAIGGTISLIEPKTIAEVSALLGYFSQNRIPYRILGGGSNLLIPDIGCPHFVIRLSPAFSTVTPLGAGLFRVGGALSLMRLSRDLSNDGYSGLEFAGGIPASLGGATWMNAGAHGGQMSDILKEVTVVREAGEVEVIQAKDLPFKYRHSGLPNNCCVVEALLYLAISDPAKTVLQRQEFLAQRKKHQPLQFPSAGSIFKNPPGPRSAGKVIEELGLRGLWEGGAQISEMHGNWIINPQRGAHAFHVSALIERCQNAVHQSFGLELEPELVRW